MAKSIFYIKTLTLLSLLMPSFFYGKQLGLNYVAQIQKMIIDKPSDFSYLRKERVEDHDYFNNFKLEIGLFQEKPTYVFVSPSSPYELPKLYARSVKDGVSVYNFLDNQDKLLASLAWHKNEEDSYALFNKADENSDNKMIFIHSQHRDDSFIEHRVFLFKNSSFEVFHNFKVSVYKGNETLAYFEPGDFNMLHEESLRELSQKEKEDVYNDYLNYKKILKSKYIPFLLEKGVFVDSCHENRDSFFGVNLLKVASIACFPIVYLYISRWH